VPGVQFDLVWKTAAGDELERLPQTFPDQRLEPGGELALPALTVPNRLGEADLLIESPQAVVHQSPGLHYVCTLCPAGSLEAVVLPAVVRGEAPPGWMDRNALRLGVLAGFLVLMWLSSRPFCRGFCPLGAFYGLTARFAVSRMGIESSACIGCDACSRVCPAELDVPKEVGGPECIACGDCMAVCSQSGISRRFGFIERKKT
jgi:ferredoxin